MENISYRLRSFYNQYNYDVIQKAYRALSQQTLFSEPYKKVPFFAEVRMKKDVFAMQINTESIISTELMNVIGFFFDRYSDDRNCVWTKSADNIKNFFEHGVPRFTEFGGIINLNLTDDAVEKIVKMLEKKSVSADVHIRLCREFKLLEEKSWREYEEYVENLIQSEINERHIEKVTCMDLPPEKSNLFAADERALGVHAATPEDGLLVSLNNLGRVDIEYIAQITGQDYKTVITALRGSIYQNPDLWEECFYKGWETANEYLSGRITDKLKKARKANEIYKGYFSENITALQRVIPGPVDVNNIYVTLGSPWVPTDVIDEFIAHIFNDYAHLNNSEYATMHDEETGTWKIPHKMRFCGNIGVEVTYGTKKINALHIIEKTLNMKTVIVTDEITAAANKFGKKRVINKAETLLALNKQEKIIEEFKSWVWTDDKRKERLCKIYNEKYCFVTARRYDGEFLTFPHMNPEEKLFDYQKNAVARIMFSPNTLLAHDVGSGKTYVMIAAGMEMRRIGISKKNLYVVPNTIVGQWKDMFLKLYPDADVLCVEPHSFAKGSRHKILSDIKYNDYDGIIMAYSCFELIPVSKTCINKATDSAGMFCFDNLDINTLFVDEAHNFKNVPVKTKIHNVLGISANGSLKCQKMMDKVRTVQRANNGRGVVFATGTPISNSLTDIFIMQKYLQNDGLSLLGLQSFDSWVGMFAQRTTEFEVDVDTNKFRMATRFTRFHNMPELSVLLSSVSDFHQVDKTNGIPENDGYKDIVISKTRGFEQYLNEISERADMVRKKAVSPKHDNMLKITTDGRKAALDLRLVNSNALFEYSCKAARCAENVSGIYAKTLGRKSTQLIFCDTSTPKQSFNLYDELKGLLVLMGINADEIAYIHDAATEIEREELFEKVRRGGVRVLIGSTFKLGLGVNVQDKLFALHHLDVPWRPSDMIQREGRILRKGNENTKIEIYRYITEGSFDAYSWQLLESKQRMICAVLSGCMTERMCEEIADIALDYAEVKAISIGNPFLKQRVETANELERIRTLQKKLAETRQTIAAELAKIPAQIECQKMMIQSCERDIDFYTANKRKYDNNKRRELRRIIFRAIKNNDLPAKDNIICSYQGFDVVLPANMLKTKPFIYLQKNGRYYIEMGLSETGVLRRIDNYLDRLDDYCRKLKANLEQLRQREHDIKEELAKKDVYSEDIERLNAELLSIDEKLGMKAIPHN